MQVAPGPDYRAITPRPFFTVSTRSGRTCRHEFGTSDVTGTEMDKIGTGKDEIRMKLGRERTC